MYFFRYYHMGQGLAHYREARPTFSHNYFAPVKLVRGVVVCSVVIPLLPHLLTRFTACVQRSRFEPSEQAAWCAQVNAILDKVVANARRKLQPAKL